MWMLPLYMQSTLKHVKIVIRLHLQASLDLCSEQIKKSLDKGVSGYFSYFFINTYVVVLIRSASVGNL